MKKMVAGLMMAVGCSTEPTGSSCSVDEVSGGVDVRCDDGTSAFIVNGTDGQDGADGAAGELGPQGNVGEPGATGETGVQGPMGEAGLDGEDGAVGATGPAGEAGGGVNIAALVGSIANDADAVVVVECDTGTGLAFGSGTKLGDGTVITAQHVVSGTTGCDVYSEAPTTLLGSSSAIEIGDRDVAILTMAWTAAGDQIEGLDFIPSYQPSLGDLVVVVGHPGVYDTISLETQYTSGYVTAEDVSATLATPTFNTATFWSGGYTIEAVAWHGSSGGPVFNDSGAWIGILVGAYNGGPENLGPDLSVVIPL